MLPAQAPAAQRRHIGLDPGLINADQAPGVKLVLIGLPACALERDVAAGLLGRQYRFFEAQPLRMQKKPCHAQPIRTLAAQGARLVNAHLAGRQRTGLALPLTPY